MRFVTPIALVAAAAALAVGVAASQATPSSNSLATQLVKARFATARYATDLAAAKKDGYVILTRMIPTMGYHFINPTVQGFDVTRPAILVYEKHGTTWQ